MKKKKTIPKSLKENVWLYYIGEKFTGKCSIQWCNKNITPFNFETGHNIPESKGGVTSIHNLRPICASCNKSMGNRYTIDEFSKIYGGNTTSLKHKWYWRIFCKDPKIVPTDDVSN